MAPRRGFLITFSGRCGSTWLIRTLKSHREIHALGEVLGMPEEKTEIERSPAGQRRFVEELYDPHRLADEDRDPPIANGFKLQYTAQIGQFLDPVDARDALAPFDLVSIYLSRTDKFRQAISKLRGDRLKSINNGRSNLRLNELSDEKQAFIDAAFDIDPEQLETHIRRIISADEAARDFAAGIGQASYALTYEELLEDPLAKFNDILARLNVKPFDVAPEVTVKITKNDLADVVSNLDQCVEHIASTDLRAYIPTELC